MSATALQFLVCFLAIRCSLAAEFGPLGCFIDNQGGLRDLSGLVGWTKIGPYTVYTSSNGVLLSSMTVGLCGTICSIGNFAYFGVQYSDECYCGNTCCSQGPDDPRSCNMHCKGNSTEICGGASRNSVYRLLYLRPIGNEFILSDLLYLNVTSSAGPFYRSQPALHAIDCISRCDTECQAVLLSRGVCYLLKFPALPNQLANIGGEFFVRR